MITAAAREPKSAGSYGPKGEDSDRDPAEVLHSYGVRGARFRNQARATAWRSRTASIGAWRIYLLASLLGAVAYFLLPRRSIAQTVEFIGPAVDGPTISSDAFGLVDREPNSRPNRREAPNSALACSWLRI
jgi:hypothetical protein